MPRASSAACVDLEPTYPLSLEESHAVLEPYFEVMRDEYVRYGLTKCKRVRFFVAPSMHDSPRHFGVCRTDGSALLIAPELAEMPEGVVHAILAHEFGHATDFLYPGEFVLGKEGPAVRRVASEVEEKQWSRWLKSWHKRDDDVIELTADAIAHRVMGVAYGYLGPCQIQSFDAVKARPMGLR